MNETEIFKMFGQKLILSEKGPPAEIQILPFGKVESQKGEFIFDNQAAETLMKNHKNRINDLVVDYEHQTLYGGEAPAAGWIKDLEYRGQDGLWAKVEWTEKGGNYVAAKEYRYLSPVIMTRKADKRAVLLHSVALTNTPAIDGMEPIVAKEVLENKEDKMEELLKNLLIALGLAEDASEEEALTAVRALAEKCKTDDVLVNKDILELLEMKENASLDDVKGKIIALKNPAGFVKADEYQALKTILAKKESNELVTLALAEGKITPAQKEWAEAYANKDAENFKSFLAMTAKGAAVPLEELGKKAVEKKQQADDVEQQVFKNLGLSAEDIKKYGKEVTE
ncbi:MAG: phage protease [Acidaminococcaceae bacterium]